MTDEYKIVSCCPDKDLAEEEGFIVLIGKCPMILKDGNDLWDIDYCPFCGKEVAVIPINRGTKNLSSIETKKKEEA